MVVARYAVALLLAIAVICIGPSSGLATTIDAASGNGNNCLPDGWWYGLQNGNTDLNLFYDSAGTQTFQGCQVADETLSIPDQNGHVPAQVTVPSGVTAQVTV